MFPCRLSEGITTEMEFRLTHSILPYTEDLFDLIHEAGSLISLWDWNYTAVLGVSNLLVLFIIICPWFLFVFILTLRFAKSYYSQLRFKLL